MWVDRREYEALRSDRDKCWSEARVLAEQNHVLQTTVNWLCTRTTQLEKERAALVFNYMGVKVETPEYAPAPASRRAAVAMTTTAEVPLDIPGVLGQSGMFNDIGDTEAKRLGIGWDEQGAVRYGDKA